MTIVDKFSMALRRGHNKLWQISEVFQNTSGHLSAFVSFFSIEKNGGSIDIAKAFGQKVFRETEPANDTSPDPTRRAMREQVMELFKEIREDNLSLDDVNARLREETHKFYKTYIAGETITETVNLIAPNFVTKPPGDDFMQKRGWQRMLKKVGNERNITHEEILIAWGLDTEQEPGLV